MRDKPHRAPDNDPGTYLSRPTYYWPDPSTPDGLPWIMRDGHRNPNNTMLDADSWFRLVSMCENLLLAHIYGNDPTAAPLARDFLRAWFLDPATRMAPNLMYAQYVPGDEIGRSFGIIDFQRSYLLIDLVSTVGDDCLSPSEFDALLEWFDEFRHWLLASPQLEQECHRPNNHGTWLDVQVIYYDLVLGAHDHATEWLERWTMPRINEQVMADGTQPAEARRVNAFQYEIFNLYGLCVVAELARHVGVDLWHHEGRDGGSIRAALDHLIDPLSGRSPIHGAISKTNGSFSVSAESTIALRMAAERLGDDRYLDVARDSVVRQPDCVSTILYPVQRR